MGSCSCSCSALLAEYDESIQKSIERVNQLLDQQAEYRRKILTKEGKRGYLLAKLDEIDKELKKENAYLLGCNSTKEMIRRTCKTTKA